MEGISSAFWNTLLHRGLMEAVFALEENMTVKRYDENP